MDSRRHPVLGTADFEDKVTAVLGESAGVTLHARKARSSKAFAKPGTTCTAAAADRPLSGSLNSLSLQGNPHLRAAEVLQRCRESLEVFFGLVAVLQANASLDATRLGQPLQAQLLSQIGFGSGDLPQQVLESGRVCLGHHQVQLIGRLNLQQKHRLNCGPGVSSFPNDNSSDEKADCRQRNR